MVSPVGLWPELPGNYGTGQAGNTSLPPWLFWWAVGGQGTLQPLVVCPAVGTSQCILILPVAPKVQVSPVKV